MYIVMNRFKIKRGSEDAFIEIWRNRDSHLKEMKGFNRFYFLQGKTEEDYTLFSSFVEWDSKDDFDAWVNSPHFKHTHRNTDNRPNNKDIYFDSAQLECFEVIL
ncbi:antibiotic biosynthesis monooxygenase [Gilliamella sp. Fer1-1]|jgi:heme-degrading monooxygenase HmoA|uniref:antibiotic biosynthesis monooxygenase family protein n=1 Tax=unclassified Gilliamella TaxID=2685620 RepID=UPI00080D9C28|nr:antibiotic biosynthesis monooxygenase [Gilliamella apicola]OCG26506.1 antibiotic biosynthesis monooxygenase [Gilliamella apicola]OCG29045.1 antibiotic biosynthesis monooxygenase [Gilliamella apicola]OCG40371.1 antibiotic biosynthesis monooxygenase [Gilliamella apicola]OCG40806.1 antibiotic biosynthesis monooxygenase [Gilliamella apicola]OCG44043.1 antibiotic biosynthesis monooxygenase [Gilliamella apicola]